MAYGILWMCSKNQYAPSSELTCTKVALTLDFLLAITLLVCGSLALFKTECFAPIGDAGILMVALGANLATLDIISLIREYRRRPPPN